MKTPSLGVSGWVRVGLDAYMNVRDEDLAHRGLLNSIELTEKAQAVVDILLTPECPDRSVAVFAKPALPPTRKRGIETKLSMLGDVSYGIYVTVYSSQGAQELKVSAQGHPKATERFLKDHFMHAGQA